MKKPTTRDLTQYGVCTALLTVCAWISIPATVPYTLQTFAVFLAVFLFGGRRAIYPVSAYLLLGAMGVPVFSGFQGGIQCLLGPTGGYLFGLLWIPLFHWGCTRLFKHRTAAGLFGAILGLLSLYAFGSLFFSRIYLSETGRLSLFNTLKLCVIPFLLPDILKLSLAYALARRLRRFI